MAIGAYTSAYLTNTLGISLWGAIPLGGLLAGLVALLVGVPILRSHGIYLALATFSLGEIIKAVFFKHGGCGRCLGLSGGCVP